MKDNKSEQIKVMERKMSKEVYFWEKRKAVLINKHDKERVIVPIIEEKTGLQITVERSYDTDLLGTFTKEVKREGSQLDTVRLKAHKGMQLMGLDIGIASEGIFGSHPVIPFIPWNYEIVILIDKKNDIEIVGESGTTATNYDYIVTGEYHEVQEFARRILFPSHFIVLRANNEENTAIIKGIRTWKSLKRIFDQEVNNSKKGKVFIEADTRACANPTRMENIERATQDLVKKMLSRCTICGAPGFIIVDKKVGLPCESCGSPTNEVATKIYACKKCTYTEEEQVEKKQASAGRCMHCNP